MYLLDIKGASLSKLIQDIMSLMGDLINPLNPKLPFGYIILCTVQKR